MEITSNMLVKDDEHGNRLYQRVFVDENKRQKLANVYLKLKSEDRHRQLGIIDFEKRTFICKRNSKKHLHIKSNSYGFNFTLIEDPFLSIDYIQVKIDEAEDYIISKKIIADFGNTLNFKQQGFELQKFVSIKTLKQHAITQ